MHGAPQSTLEGDILLFVCVTDCEAILPEIFDILSKQVKVYLT